MSRLSDVRLEFVRRVETRTAADNARRIWNAEESALGEVLAWLNLYEPTLLREALDEAGVR